MLRQKRSISKRRPRTSFIESEATVPCTQRVQKRLIANLEQTTHSRVGAARARRARQLLEQIKAEPVVATPQRHSEPAAVAPMPPAPPVAPPSPSIKARRRKLVRTAIRNWGRAAPRWFASTGRRVPRSA